MAIETDRALGAGSGPGVKTLNWRSACLFEPKLDAHARWNAQDGDGDGDCDNGHVRACLLAQLVVVAIARIHLRPCARPA